MICYITIFYRFEPMADTCLNSNVVVSVRSYNEIVKYDCSEADIPKDWQI